MLTKLNKEELYELSERIEKSFCKGTFLYDYAEIDMLNLLIHEYQHLLDRLASADEALERQTQAYEELDKKYKNLEERHRILVKHADDQLCLIKALAAKEHENSK